MNGHEHSTSGCGRWFAGCGIAALAGLALIVLFGYLTMAPFRQAAKDEQELVERAESAPFTPAPNGAIPPERLETFLEVRAALAGPCGGIAKFDHTLHEMEALDQREHVSRTEALKMALSTTRSAMGMGRRLGSFFVARDRALLDAGMGLDEYAWTYVLAYHQRLLDPVEQAQPLAFKEPPLNARVSKTLRGVLERQRAALAAAGGTSEQLAALDAELAAMAADPHRLPWQDGLPEAVAASLAPFRERLDEGYCPSAVGIELKTNRATAHGFVIDTD